VPWHSSEAAAHCSDTHRAAAHSVLQVDAAGLQPVNVRRADVAIAGVSEGLRAPLIAEHQHHVERPARIAPGGGGRQDCRLVAARGRLSLRRGPAAAAADVSALQTV
jgi:hypothetical protein